MAYGGLCKACIERAITGANCALIGSNLTPAFEPFTVVVGMAGIDATQNRTRRIYMQTWPRCRKTNQNFAIDDSPTIAPAVEPAFKIGSSSPPV